MHIYTAANVPMPIREASIHQCAVWEEMENADTTCWPVTDIGL